VFFVSCLFPLIGFSGSVTGATFFRGITHGDRRIKVAEFQPMQSPVAAGFSLQSCWW